MAETAAIHFFPASLLPYALPVAHILLLPFLLLNLRFTGVRLILAGLALNLSAMAANGGLMPVEMSAVEAVGRHDGQELVVGDHIDGSKNVLLFREDIRLRALTDVIVLPVPQPFTRAISLGDIAIVVGLVAICASLARTGLRRRGEPNDAPHEPGTPLLIPSIRTRGHGWPHFTSHSQPPDAGSEGRRETE